MADSEDIGLERERLDFEREKHAAEVRLAETRLGQEAAGQGRLSTGAVAVIGAVIALVSAGTTASLEGFFRVESEEEITSRQVDLDQRKVEADLDRLRREQQFQILLRATESVPIDVAAKNLEFFVDIGYLDDPTGNIKDYARRGLAPQLVRPGENPLLQRMEAAQRTASDHLAVIDDVLVGPPGETVAGVPTDLYGALESRSYLVIHSTIGSAEGALSMMRRGDSSGSYHVIVGREGKITELLPFDLAALHVGTASWGPTRLQRNSIGISLENLGRLTRDGEAWLGPSGQQVAAEAVVVLPGDPADVGWQNFPPEQIAATVALLGALRDAYPEIRDVIGHSDVDPHRKIDPGPAFPMETVRREVFGRPAALPPG